MKDRQSRRAKLIGGGLALVGIALAGVSGFADVLGLGAMPQQFGYRQFLGTAVGFSLLVVGFAIALTAGSPDP